MSNFIRSFVRREGRITPRQQQGLKEYFPRWGLTVESGMLDFENRFGNDAPVILEIGFGMGDSLLEMAALNPETQYLGVEVHRPGVGHMLASIAEKNLTNIHVFCEDVVSVLQSCIAEDSLSAIYIFFPDPWPKKRHNKRRLIQAPFVSLLTGKLKEGGILHLATDWQDYAEQMMDVLSREAQLKNPVGVGQFAPRPETRPLTKFEKRGQKLGHGVWDLVFEKW